MRIGNLAWPLPFLVRLGWATARVPNPEPGRALGHVYFLRGQGAIFSSGFGRLCAAMRQAGWWAEDLRCVGDLWLSRHLKREWQCGRLRGPIVLVGHSCGGRAALHVARQMTPLGIPIRLLVCVDVAFAPSVPANVEHAIHLYRGSFRLYPAAPLTSDAQGKVVLENVDLDAGDGPPNQTGLHHLNMTGRPAIQSWILSRIRSTLETPAEGLT